MGNGPGQNATVEEILASIRQAIADDDAKRTISRPASAGDERRDAPAGDERRGRPHLAQAYAAADDSDDDAIEGDDAARAAADAEADEDRLLLAEAESAVEVPEVIEQAIDQAIDGVRAEIEAERATIAGRYARAGLQSAMPRAATRPMSAVRRQMTAIPRPPTLLSQGPDAQVSASFDRLAKAMVSGDGTKLDAAVEDVLRPMLKNWLDANLPQLVERLIREEIERVARGRR